MSDVWLVTLTTGEYSDTCVTFLRVYGTEGDARQAAVTATKHLEEAVSSRDGDWYADSDDLTPEEREAMLLPRTGYVGSLSDEPRWEVHRVPAEGMFLPRDILARQRPKISVP